RLCGAGPSGSRPHLSNALRPPSVSTLFPYTTLFRSFPGTQHRLARAGPVQPRLALAGFPFAPQLLLGGGELGGRVALAEGIAGLVRGGVVVVGIAFHVIGLAAVLLVPVTGVGELLGGRAAGHLVAGRAHRRLLCGGWNATLSGAALNRPIRRVSAVLGIQLAALLASYGSRMAPVP